MEARAVLPVLDARRTCLFRQFRFDIATDGRPRRINRILFRTRLSTAGMKKSKSSLPLPQGVAILRHEYR